MARGGARVGAGRKPTKGKVLGMPGTPASQQPPRAATDKEKAALLSPPRYLSVEAKRLWKRYAPSAITTGMLTPETLPGFEQLVQVCERWQQLGKILDKEGWQIKIGEIVDGKLLVTDQKRHPLWPQLQTYEIRREQELARFGLHGVGKPAPRPAGQEPVNPWSARESRKTS